ncbi:MAG: PAS domain-containing protein [Thiogranum sp.]|nr:PAS domain-containing protein [Thiogranum sp.]
MQPSNNRPVRAGVFALVVILIIGALLINAYVKKERQRDLEDWSVRLGLVAETRVEVIETWLAAQDASLTELANNASLQLYLWQLSQREDEDKAAEPAQLAYLRNLVLASATRYGFEPQDRQPAITANVPRHYATGLALFDAAQRVVVSTSGMPDIGTAFQATIAQAAQTGKTAFSRLVLDSHERVLLGIAVPVPVVLGAQGEQAFGGVILGVHNAARTLFPLLRSGVPMTGADESLLVQQEDNQVIYLSPTLGGGIPTRKSLPLDRSSLAAAVAVRQPGEFGEFRNYLGHPVLATSRPLRSVPWVLVQEVDAVEALQESNRHRRFLITSFSLLLFFIAATLVAAWRHGSSVRALHDADTLRAQSLALKKQTELLHAVTDNTEACVLLLDDQQRVLFANAQLAKTVAAEPEAVTGNLLSAVIGPANARPMTEAIEQLQKQGTAHHCTRNLFFGGQERTYQCSLVPVDRVGERYNAILLVLNDITELQRMQQQHATLLRRLIQTLMHVVDLHDPYSAHHSSRMVEVANAVGRELKLGEADLRTLDMAASLANLGKIFVPKEILTKTTPLTEAEHELLQRHVQYGVELLEDLEFEGPVLDTISQKQEHLDGSGYPAGLKDGEILFTARILAVANAFVALVSPRAYRDGIGIKAALNRLLEDADRRYDRRVVAALFHVSENRSDWSEWLEESGEIPE